MKISWQGFLGRNHSWAYVAQNICRELDKSGNQVEMSSTNGLDHFPNDLKHLLREQLSDDYDLEMSYTAMKNFPAYLNHSKKSKKFGIWCFEWCGKNALPEGFSKHYKNCDRILPPSEYAKQVFLESGVPEQSMTVIPHGYNVKDFEEAEKYNIHNDKIKILLNVGQPHLRKGLDITLEAFGSAFTRKDNVCFVIKVVDKKVEQPFEVSFSNLFQSFHKKYPNHAEVIVIKDFIPNMYSLYKACDIHFNMTRAEGFGLPFLEAAISGLVNISPNFGGMKDFCNENNSLLVGGKMDYATPSSLYYQHKLGVYWFTPSKTEAVDKLRYAVDNVVKLKEKFSKNNEKIKEEYTWKNVSKKIVNLYESIK